MSLETLSREILEHLRILQRKNRAVSFVGGGRLTLAESHLLTELAVLDSVNQKELSQRLNLPKQTISRLVKNLSERGLLRRHPSFEDRRAQDLSLTSRGAATVRIVDRAANPILRTLLRRLPRQDRGALEQSFCMLADGLGVESQIARRSEPSFRAQVRRLTRGLRLLETRAFGTAVTVLEWHILAEVSRTAMLNVAELAKLLAARPDTVLQAVRKMSAKRWLHREDFPGDRRKFYLILTGRGEAALDRANRAGVDLLNLGLRRFDSRAQQRLLQLLRNISGDGDTGEVGRLTEIKNPLDLQAARALAVRFYAERSHAAPIPAQFFAGDCRCLGLLIEKRMVAALELQSSETGLQINNLVYLRRFVTPALAANFARRALHFFS
ncbi:MAG: MarR family transcriptional regulator [Oligoflexia bacterium]|nr:MarR family transcriptional regulator [Oligoflexia bacterium]